MLSRRAAHRILTVARHEYAALIRSKMFLFGLFLPCVAIAVAMWWGVPRAEPRQPATASAVVEQPAAGPASRDDRSGAQVPNLRPIGRQVVGTRMGMAFLFMYLMLMGMMGTGQQLLISLIEEKGSRVIEVLLSAVSPGELMAGKILGLGTAGLTATAACGIVLLGLAARLGLATHVPVLIMAWFVLYFVLGFLLAASVYAGIGSACNTPREAQGLLIPLTLLFVSPLFFWVSIARNPSSPLALVLSYFPPATALVMVLRLAVDSAIALWQIATTLVVLGVSVPLAMRAAAKVFRTGILMYGKPPRLGEMLRWVRQQ